MNITTFLNLMIPITVSASFDSVKNSASKILVINTGGTASMIKVLGVYVPCKGTITQIISDSNYHYSKVLNSKEDEFILKDSDKTITFVVKETEKLIDSSCLTTKNWVEIAGIIKENHSYYDAFIVIHGTDTLAYTAAALSFMLRKFNKTVIITGSMKPFSDSSSDFPMNFANSLIFAANLIISEPVVIFQDRVLIATRVKKISATELDAFDSPNSNLLGRTTNFPKPMTSADDQTHEVEIDLEICDKVRVIKLYPGFDSILLKTLNLKNTRGIILETYGTGNSPTEEMFIDHIKELVNKGIVIVNVSQVLKGNINGIYEPSKVLKEAGVLSGRDMTTEAAFAKLSYLLGRFEDVEVVKRQFNTLLKSEFTPN